MKQKKEMSNRFIVNVRPDLVPAIERFQKDICKKQHRTTAVSFYFGFLKYVLTGKNFFMIVGNEEELCLFKDGKTSKIGDSGNISEASIQVKYSKESGTVLRSTLTEEII